MQQDEMTFGTEPHKLVRKEGPDTSMGAAVAVDSKGLEHEVYLAVHSFGAAGCISDEVRALPQFARRPYSSVTARFKALLDKGYIVDTGRRRDGVSGHSQRVLVSKGHAQ